MRKMKKLASLLTAVVMVIGLFAGLSIGSYAGTTYEQILHAGDMGTDPELFEYWDSDPGYWPVGLSFAAILTPVNVGDVIEVRGADGITVIGETTVTGLYVDQMIYCSSYPSGDQVDVTLFIKTVTVEPTQAKTTENGTPVTDATQIPDGLTDGDLNDTNFSQDPELTFEVLPCITLSITDGIGVQMVVDFGQISPLLPMNPTESITARVQSNIAYDVVSYAMSDFADVDSVNPDIDINTHLLINGEGAQADCERNGEGENLLYDAQLVTGGAEPGSDDGRDHSINMELIANDFDEMLPGTYSATLRVIARAD